MYPKTVTVTLRTEATDLAVLGGWVLNMYTALIVVMSETLL